MIPRSLAWRSTLAALISILIALLIVSAGVDVLIGRHLHGSLDRSLRDRAVSVAQLSATAPALLVSPGALDAPAGGTQVLTQVLDRRSRIVAATHDQERAVHVFDLHERRVKAILGWILGHLLGLAPELLLLYSDEFHHHVTDFGAALERLQGFPVVEQRRSA